MTTQGSLTNTPVAGQSSAVTQPRHSGYRFSGGSSSGVWPQV